MPFEDAYVFIHISRDGGNPSALSFTSRSFLFSPHPIPAALGLLAKVLDMLSCSRLAIRLIADWINRRKRGTWPRRLSDRYYCMSDPSSRSILPDEPVEESAEQPTGISIGCSQCIFRFRHLGGDFICHHLGSSKRKKLALTVHI